MEQYRNQVAVKGTLQGMPEWRLMPSQKKMLSFYLKTHAWMNLPVHIPQVHRVVAWDDLADEADRILRSERNVVVDGALVTRTILDENGDYRTTIEIRLKSIRRAEEMGLRKAG
ncbi:MAG: Single-strand binding protein family [Bacteroidota bacterium]|jgi:single-stranded DNA-binding protein